MPVNNTHNQYTLAQEDWTKIRDAMAGDRRVKEYGKKYLPTLEGQTEEGYAGYLSRASFYEASPRTVDGLSGAIFRKDPNIVIPEAWKPRLDRVSSGGDSLVMVMKETVDEVITTGRIGVLVDMAKSNQSKAAESFLVQYKAEQIVNWRTLMINGMPQLSLVVLQEFQERTSPKDPFTTIQVERYRVLSLSHAEGEEVPYYTVEVWEEAKHKNGSTTFIIVEPPVQPTRRGERLEAIPFWFIAPQDLSPSVSRSPIMGLINLNFSHYRTTADLEHGAHFTAMPTPVIIGDLAGNAAKGSTLSIGSGVAWQIEAGGDAKMLEYRGQGLGALENIQNEKEKRMAVLGARLLEEPSKNVEAAETHDLRHRGENSLLASISDTVSRAFTQIVSHMIWWEGGGEQEAKVELNRDFVDKKMSMDEVIKMVQSWQSGGIGQETMYYNLQQGERLRDGMTYEEYLEDVKKNGPPEPKGSGQ